MEGKFLFVGVIFVVAEFVTRCMYLASIRFARGFESFFLEIDQFPRPASVWNSPHAQAEDNASMSNLESSRRAGT